MTVSNSSFSVESIIQTNSAIVKSNITSYLVVSSIEQHTTPSMVYFEVKLVQIKFKLGLSKANRRAGSFVSVFCSKIAFVIVDRYKTIEQHISIQMNYIAS